MVNKPILPVKDLARMGFSLEDIAMTENSLRQKPLPAGRELDALIAEKVMGYTYEKRKHWEDWFSPFENGGRSVGLPYFSTDIGAAWSVVEKIMSQHHPFQLECMDTKNFRASFTDSEAVSESAPHAVCLAALKALGA